MFREWGGRRAAAQSAAGKGQVAKQVPYTRSPMELHADMDLHSCYIKVCLPLRAHAHVHLHRMSLNAHMYVAAPARGLGMAWPSRPGFLVRQWCTEADDGLRPTCCRVLCCR